MAQAARLDAADRGANVTLLPAQDDGVSCLPDRLRPAGVQETLGHAGPMHSIQLYLDMGATGGRCAEQVENLRKGTLRI
jgi:hypothetical protein